MQKLPPYSIASVDRALQLLTVLREEGSISVTEAAERLDVSVSTAHRLLAMLVFRGYARQTSDRRYFAGPALAAPPVPEPPVQLLREVALPHLRRLCHQVAETTNLFARAGRELQFVATVEPIRALRVGGDIGRALPLHLASGGRAILATMPLDEIMEVYRDSDVDPSAIAAPLAEIRAVGYAVKDDELEPEIFAVGTALRTGRSTASAALSVSMPSTRSSAERTAELVPVLLAATRELQVDLDHRLDLESTAT